MIANWMIMVTMMATPKDIGYLINGSSICVPRDPSGGLYCPSYTVRVILSGVYQLARKIRGISFHSAFNNIIPSLFKYEHQRVSDIG